MSIYSETTKNLPDYEPFDCKEMFCETCSFDCWKNYSEGDLHE